MLVDELAAVIRIDSAQRAATVALMVIMAWTTPWRPLPLTAWRSTQQVWIFTLSKVWRNSPLAEAPECDTRSISR